MMTWCWLWRWRFTSAGNEPRGGRRFHKQLAIHTQIDEAVAERNKQEVKQELLAKLNEATNPRRLNQAIDDRMDKRIDNLRMRA
jgi:hypothetical protein